MEFNLTKMFICIRFFLLIFCMILYSIFQGDFRWCSAAGQSVILTETNIAELCKSERRALQRLALLKLQALSIHCTIPAYKGVYKFCPLNSIRS